MNNRLIANGGMGERGVVVIDGDQATVRLVRIPEGVGGELEGELAPPLARAILMGFLRVRAPA